MEHLDSRPVDPIVPVDKLIDDVLEDMEEDGYVATLATTKSWHKTLVTALGMVNALYDQIHALEDEVSILKSGRTL